MSELPEGFEDVFEGGGVQVTKTPGGRQPSARATGGHFAHDNFETLETLLKGSEEELVPGLRRGLQPEHEIPIPEYSRKPRVDRVDWENAEVIEIKPDSPYWRKQGMVEAQQYAEWMNKYEPRADGRLWTPRTAHYDLDAVVAFLRRIGYLE